MTVFRESKIPFEFCVNNMPNLQYIITLGKDSFEFVTKLYCKDKLPPWSECLQKQVYPKLAINNRTINLFPTRHPGSRGVQNESGRTKDEKLEKIESSWEKYFKKHGLFRK